MTKVTTTNKTIGNGRTAVIAHGDTTSAVDKLADRQIFITDDYARFEFKDNRRIDQRHVQNLKARIEAKNLSAESPIRVTKEYVIRDGQHHFHALMELGLPIYYIFSDMTVVDTPIFNASHKAWRIMDFLEYYCDRGIREYQVFSGFMHKYNFTCGTALAIVSGYSGGYPSKMFRDGELTIKDKLIDCQVTADKLFECRDFLTFHMGRSFVLAMMEVFNHPDYDHKTMLRKMEMRQSAIHLCGNRDEYLRMLEKVYNYKNTTKVRFL